MNIFEPTEAQRQANVAFLWLNRNDPDASTIGVRALVRPRARCFAVGQVTEHGTVAEIYLTAYRMTDGTVVSFTVAHPRSPVTPLVVFG